MLVHADVTRVVVQIRNIGKNKKEKKKKRKRKEKKENKEKHVMEAND